MWCTPLALPFFPHFCCVLVECLQNPLTSTFKSGNTGAGKSSLINALLDEEKYEISPHLVFAFVGSTFTDYIRRLVPTSGMRACTAAVTEISYNDSDDPSRLYRAEIKFIDSQDWTLELQSLLDDLQQDGQLSKNRHNAETPAGVAYAKLKAVYPGKNIDALLKGNPNGMSAEAGVREVLGTVKRISATTAADLYNNVQQYIDSRETRVGSGGAMQYWPLIKSVHIYCKAPALSTGAVIVDLPGSQDSVSSSSYVN